LTLSCPEDLPVLETDATKLRQVLLNLLSNATKFTSRGSITVRALVRPPDAPPDTQELVVTVSDTGIGIAPERMGQLFQPFTQATASTARLYGGTGLGLALSRHLCEMLGGSIQLESELGRGTTVTVRLPLRLARDTALARDTTPAPVESRGAIVAPGMQPLLVLGIDGDQGRALQLQHAFAQEAITLVPALNATEGLQLARDLRPDALLLDAALRDAEGERLLDRIKDDPELAGLPVILLDSAYQALASEPVRAQALIEALKAVQAQPVGSVAATNGEEQ